VEVGGRKRKMGSKNGFFKEAQKLKYLKKYSREWKKSSLED